MQIHILGLDVFAAALLISEENCRKYVYSNRVLFMCFKVYLRSEQLICPNLEVRYSPFTCGLFYCLSATDLSEHLFTFSAWLLLRWLMSRYIQSHHNWQQNWLKCMQYRLFSLISKVWYMKKCIVTLTFYKLNDKQTSTCIRL